MPENIVQYNVCNDRFIPSLHPKRLGAEVFVEWNKKRRGTCVGKAVWEKLLFG